jgi:hypothetical protein
MLCFFSFSRTVIHGISYMMNTEYLLCYMKTDIDDPPKFILYMDIYLNLGIKLDIIQNAAYHTARGLCYQHEKNSTKCTTLKTLKSIWFYNI